MIILMTISAPTHRKGAPSSQGLVVQVKAEREMLFHQIEANQSTIIRSQIDRQAELSARKAWRQHINYHAIV